MSVGVLIVELETGAAVLVGGDVFGGEGYGGWGAAEHGVFVFCGFKRG